MPTEDAVLGGEVSLPTEDVVLVDGGPLPTGDVALVYEAPLPTGGAALVDGGPRRQGFLLQETSTWSQLGREEEGLVAEEAWDCHEEGEEEEREVKQSLEEKHLPERKDRMRIWHRSDLVPGAEEDLEGTRGVVQLEELPRC